MMPTRKTRTEKSEPPQSEYYHFQDLTFSGNIKYPGVKVFCGNNIYIKKAKFPKPDPDSSYEELFHQISSHIQMQNEEKSELSDDKMNLGANSFSLLLYNQILQNCTLESYKTKAAGLQILIDDKKQQCENIMNQQSLLYESIKNMEKSKAAHTNYKKQTILLKAENDKMRTEIETLHNEIRVLKENQYQATQRSSQIEEELNLLLNKSKIFEFDPEGNDDNGKLIARFIRFIDKTIQINSELIEENKQLREELESYKNLTQELTDKISLLFSSLEEAEHEFEQIKRRLHAKDMVISRLEKMYHREKQRINLIMRNHKKVQQEIITEISNREMDEAPPPQFRHKFLVDLVRNDTRSPFSRSYTERTVDLCYVLHAYSPVTYEFLRNLLPLPSYETIRKKYKDVITKKTLNLLNVDQLTFILNEIRESYEPESNEETIPAAIAFDAAAADPKKTNSGAIFLFNEQPLNQKYDPRPVHVDLNKNGKAKQEHIEEAKSITNEAKVQHIVNRYVCTDSDSATNQIHCDFEEYMKHAPQKDFQSLIQYADKYTELIPISDLLHILKNLRSRLIAHKIHIADVLPALNFIEICQERNVEEELYKQSKVISMRDDLALKIFHTDNLKSLFEEEIWNEYVFILPYIILINVIQSNTLTVGARLQMLELAYTMLEVIFAASFDFPEIPREKNGKQQEAKYITRNQKRRTQNDIIALAHALTFYSDGIAFSRLGTHLVEFKFGEMRRMSYGNNSANVLLGAVVRAEVVKEVCEQYDVHPKRRGRIDFGGAKMSERWTISFPFKDNSPIIEELIRLLHESSLGTEDLPILKELTDFLHIKSPSPIVKLQGELAGTQIYERNIHYHVKEEEND